MEKTINQQLNALFEKWKDERKYDSAFFVSDGLVYKYNKKWAIEKESDSVVGSVADVFIDELWKFSSLRIAFLLKDTPDHWNDDIRQWLLLDTNNGEHTRTLSGGKVSKTGFLPNIARILFGLAGIKELKYADFDDFKRKFNEQIIETWNTLPFAFVETKKIAGNPSVSIGEIKKYLRTDGYLLKEELDILQPNIIICTCAEPQFKFVTEKYLGSEEISEEDKILYRYPQAESVECCLWYYRKKGVVVIKSYHPTYRGKIPWTIFERVISPMRALLKKYPDLKLSGYKN